MGITEGDFTSLGRLSEGIEESIFGKNERFEFSKDVLAAGDRFGKGANPGGKIGISSVPMFLKMHYFIISRKVDLLVGSDDFWSNFSTTASTIRDNAILASVSSSSHAKINSAYQTFISELEQKRASVPKFQNGTITQSHFLL